MFNPGVWTLKKWRESITVVLSLHFLVSPSNRCNTLKYVYRYLRAHPSQYYFKYRHSYTYFANEVYLFLHLKYILFCCFLIQKESKRHFFVVK